MKINCYSRPNEPAVIPTLTKKPNSNKSFAPVGIEIKVVITTNGSIYWARIRGDITGEK